jgi:uncharacterized membrane protein
MADPPTHIFEQRKAWGEYIKHLTTLSTGSIILLAAFLEKFFAQPKWKVAVVITLCGFTLSNIASVRGYSDLKRSFPGVQEPTERDRNTWAASIVVALSSFLLSIITLTVFAIRNLFA